MVALLNGLRCRPMRGYALAAAGILWLFLLSLNGSILPKSLASHSQPGSLDFVVAFYKFKEINTKPSFFDVPTTAVSDGTPTEQRLVEFLSLRAFSKSRRRVFFYVKNDFAPVPTELLNSLAQRAGIDQVEISPLPNIGRESHTYLHHIIAHYSSLADHTVFMQENLDWATSTYARNADALFSPSTAFMGIQDHILCNCACFWPGPAAKILRDYFPNLNKGSPCSEHFHVTLAGNFIVSKPRILSHPKDFYEALGERLMANTSLSDKYENLDYGTQQSPIFGYLMEILWGKIFGCSFDHELPNSPVCKDALPTIKFLKKGFYNATVCTDQPLVCFDT